jgi:hypothetical protein
MFEASNADVAEVFVYTGPGESPPQNVVRVRVDPSIASIHAEAFERRKKLAEVELCEGLVEIGKRSFLCTDHSITTINIPNSLRRICHLQALFDVQFVFTMVLKALEYMHLLAATSPTLESHPSSQ